MVHILLLILKIIGMILLVVLGIALLLLIVPVRYKGRGEFEQKSAKIKITAHWLFHIIYFSFSYENRQQKYSLRVLGIPIPLSFKEKKDRDRKKVSHRPERRTEKKGKEHQTKKEKRAAAKDTEGVKTETAKNIISDTPKNINPEAAENINTKRIEPDKSIPKKKWQTGLQKIFNRIKAFWNKIISVIKRILENVKDSYHKTGEIKKITLDEATKEAYGYGKDILFRLIRHVKPRNIRANIRLGFAYPDVTGKTLGYLAMAYAAFGINPKKIQILPDFENKIFEGNIRMKGRFMIGVVLIHVLRLYLKKEIRDFIDKVH